MVTHVLPRYAASVVLVKAEEHLVECAGNGRRWTPYAAMPENWHQLPIEDESCWPDACKLDAGLLRCLLTNSAWREGDIASPISPNGLWIENAYIADTLDLQGCQLATSLWMKNCIFARGIRLRDSITHTIGFNGSRVGKTRTPDFDPISIDAVRAQVKGKLYLADKFYAVGEVNFASAKIGGQMDCKDGCFNGSEEDREKPEDFVALRCDAIEVDDGVLLSGRFHATGKVDFEGARVGSSFDCSGGRFENPGQTALNCSAIRVGVDVRLRTYRRENSQANTSGTAFRSIGLVDLNGAKIESILDCSGGQFTCSRINGQGRQAVALHADGVVVRGNAILNRVKAKGVVRFRGAKIGGYFGCHASEFETGPSEHGGAQQQFALQCSGITVGDRVSLNDGKFGIGGVDFSRARISGSFSCEKATFDNVGTPPYCADFAALKLSNTRIVAGLFLEKVRSFRGCLNLEQAEAATVHDDGSMWLPRDLRDEGSMEAALHAPTAEEPATDKKFNYGCLRRRLLLRYWQESEKDNIEQPLDTCVIKLDGFTYHRFIQERLGDDKCSFILIAWLKCQPKRCKSIDFKPQPWQQLAKVMRDMGHAEFARRIAIKFRWLDSFRYYGKGPQKIVRCLRILFGFLTWVFVGFGYRPRRPLWWAGALIALGWVIFSAAGNLGYMAPRDGAVVAYLAQQEKRENEACKSSEEKKQCDDALVKLPGYYPHFNAFVYAVDVFIPVLELGQEQAWEPSLEQHGSIKDGDYGLEKVGAWLGQKATWDTGNAICRGTRCGGFGMEWFLGKTMFVYGWHRAIYWFEVISGWFLVSLFITGISGIMKKD